MGIWNVTYDFFSMCHVITSSSGNKILGMIMHGHRYEVDSLEFEKFQNAIFFQDIQISFQWVTGIGPEPHQNFFEKNSNKYSC